MKPLIAYAVVKKNRPKLSAKEIYADNDIKISKDEKIVKVIIKLK